MAVPTKDAELLAWAGNADTRITASPATFGTTAGFATSYHALYLAYSVAYAAVSTDGARSKALTAQKDATKRALTTASRELYALVQGNLSVTDANKVLLDVRIRKTEPTPVPPPTAKPSVEVLEVSGHAVRVRFKNTELAGGRGLPVGSIGLNVFTHVGPTAPADAAGWKFEAGTGRLDVTLTFASDLAPGTKVWVTGFFFNRRKESGPAADPVGVLLQGGSALPLAA